MLRELRKNEDVLNIFTYGSAVYGTNTDQSDIDYIIVSNSNELILPKFEKIDFQIYAKEQFQQDINKHSISALECLFLPSTLILKNSFDFSFELNKKKLRESVSHTASNSWVKAKKKFEVKKDRDVYKAKKSLFHSLRIIDFGIQIANSGKINNYSSMNNICFEILDSKEDRWNSYKEKYQEFFNSKMSEFRKVAPK